MLLINTVTLYSTDYTHSCARCVHIFIICIHASMKDTENYKSVNFKLCKLPFAEKKTSLGHCFVLTSTDTHLKPNGFINLKR